MAAQAKIAANDAQSQASLHFGKSIHNSSFRDVPRSAIAEVGAILATMPVGKAKKKKKTDAPAGGDAGPDAGSKKKKGKKGGPKPSDAPDVPPMVVGPPMRPD